MNGSNANLLPWVTEKFISAAPRAAAQALAALATHEAVLLLKPLKAEYMVACLEPMDCEKAAAILRRLPSRQAAHVLSRLDLRQAARIFGAFSVPQREKMKTLLPLALQRALEKSAQWPQDSAGAAMTTDFLTFKTEAKLQDIVEKLKTLPRKKLPSACLILSREGQLKGMIRTAELSFYALSSTVGSVMSPVQSVPAQTPLCQAAPLVQQGQPLVPVTDETGLVLGVLKPEQLAAACVQQKKRFGWF